MTDFLDRVIARDVLAERDRQDLKWGPPTAIPNGTGSDVAPLRHIGVSYIGTLDHGMGALLLRDVAQDATEWRTAAGDVTMADILLEEVFEALAESDPSKLRAELVQVAAVAQKWIRVLEPSSADAARKVVQVSPAHLRILFLLAENNRNATDTRLTRLYAAKVARSGSLAWPFISDAGIRSRRAELVRWGLVEWATGDWERTLSNRPTKVWRVGPGNQDFRLFEPIPPWSGDTLDTFRRLLDEAGSDLVVAAVLRWAARAGGVNA